MTFARLDSVEPGGPWLCWHFAWRFGFYYDLEVSDDLKNWRLDSSYGTNVIPGFVRMIVDRAKRFFRLRERSLIQ